MTKETSLEEFAVQNLSRRVADGPLVKKGHQEAIAVPAAYPAATVRRCVMVGDKMVYGPVDYRVAEVQERSRILMREREDQIGNGLVHLTAAMEDDLRKVEAAYLRKVKAASSGD